MTIPPIDILKQYWGYPEFRPMQEEIIQSVLDGKDTLALLPTGGGKSICFQVPALCQEGICIVISPLIALMKDQVFQLQKRNIKAEAIYSGIHYRAIDRILDNCAYGNIKFLYLSPERLTSELVRERLKKMKVNLVAIDEAHCISQWGYDFRPPYLQIAEIRDFLPEDIPFIALTATATSEVVLDIQEKLEFRAKNVFQKSFKRDNLAYVVLHEEQKLVKLLEIVRNVKGSGIVYVRSRRQTKEIAAFLQRNNVSADYYHAGLSTQNRSARQDAWIKNTTRIMVSTNAFGMGIDKADVRTVVHMDLPNNLEAYFQEAGRAGRDGKKSYAVLLYEIADKERLKYGFEQAFPPIKEIKRVYQALGSYLQLAVGGGEGESFDFDIIKFTKNFDLNLVTAYSSIKLLEQDGWVLLSDALFRPASLKIMVNKGELYDYYLRNKKHEVILKTILRAYQGLFNDFGTISESKIANHLKIKRADLSKALKLMQQEGIIAYREEKDSPQLTLLQERVDAKNLTIDTAMYEFRKRSYQERMNKAIKYAEEDICRSQQLLFYFGEDSKACGVCDVCLNRKSTALNNDEFERYKMKIQAMLQKEDLSLDEVADSFVPKRREKVLKTIDYLLDEGILELENGKLLWRKNE